MTLARRTPIKRGKRPNPVNKKRKAKRYARNYGDAADFIRDQPCYVTRRVENIVAAHPIPKARSKSEGLVPLAAEVELDWHALDEEKWNRKYARSGKTKHDVRCAAPMYARMYECHVNGEPFEVEF